MSELTTPTETSGATSPPPGGGADLYLVDVTKRFGSFTAVDDLTLTIPAGSFFALLGPSGCGKTTTLRMVAGLEEPSAGRIVIGSEDVSHNKPYKRPVNTVFQSYALFPHLDIFENVAFGLRRTGSKNVREDVESMLDLVELLDICQAQAVTAVWWSAAACGGGQGTHQQARGSAARRTTWCSRPQAAASDADRAQADPA